MSCDCCVLHNEGRMGRCPHQGKTIAEHCAAGFHCTSSTASCAMENTYDDHPRRCCDCKAQLDA